jgi:ketosteroid isomerase-like protein
MQRSPEIEQVMRDMVEAIDRGDVELLYNQMLSGDDAAVMIGTDPHEYTRNHAEMRQMIADSTPQGPHQMHATLDDVHGHAGGDIGWADGTGSFTREHDTVAIRFTAVFRREQGAWRCVQAHASIGVPNEMMFDPSLQTEKASQA